ncbi:hypothetical protein [Halalkalibacter wakoensis]|uniref:hypothetical protein n=1 Tax=Halalkalibacter wakoensis TaxID=127891 RepID=UPI00054EDE40|nr:hypothetical protein [Halalkalibacter wakoensis]
MFRKYGKVWFAIGYILLVLLANSLFDISSIVNTALFAVYLVFIWTYDIIKMKREEKKNDPQT